jgi:hypothetical protein
LNLFSAVLRVPRASSARDLVQRIVRHCRVAIEAPGWVRRVINQHDVTFVQTTTIDYGARRMVIDSVNDTFRARCVKRSVRKGGLQMGQTNK